jgi:hypothetical protein
MAVWQKAAALKNNPSLPVFLILVVSFTSSLGFSIGQSNSSQSNHAAPVIMLAQGSTQNSTDEVLALLEKLPVKGRAPKTGYSRAAFGPQWSDIDRNGCDTRNDILKRDLTNIVFREKTRDCVVESGTLLDPFSNSQIEFKRGEKTSFLVQIDHVVSLSNAWQTGIFRASLKDRTLFANDPLNLLAVKGSLNSQKSDGDAATWLPPYKPFRCKFVSIQVEVKSKYQLWVTKAEKDAILRVLNSTECRAISNSAKANK